MCRSRSRNSERHHLRAVPADATNPLTGFLASFASTRTAATYRSALRELVGKTPTEAQLVKWAIGNGRPLANNTIRTRITAATSYYEWCARQGLPTPDLHALKRLRRQYPKTYGKVQDANPGRWLDRDEADRLIAACHDDTAISLRDEIVIRLGLSGLRVSEIAALVVGDLQLTGKRPLIAWTGKGNKPRKATPSAALIAAVMAYLDEYTDALGSEPRPAMPLVCPATSRGWTVRFGERVPHAPQALLRIISGRAVKAGLGHVAPHDLRRSAAGILHNAKTDDGAHHFDLLDIQKVLGHADPATTMRSYLDPIDTEVIDRAADYLG